MSGAFDKQISDRVATGRAGCQGIRVDTFILKIFCRLDSAIVLRVDEVGAEWGRLFRAKYGRGGGAGAVPPPVQ